MSPIITDIYNLRNSITPSNSEIYYTKDLGQEGNWKKDPFDYTSNDNTGLIIVAADGSRMKRIYDGVVNVKWFGAKGDAFIKNASPTNDTFAIQLAIDTMQQIITNPINFEQNLSITKSSGDLFFPAGYYLIDSVTINYSGFSGEIGKLNIIGSGIKSTIFIGNSQFIKAPEGSQPIGSYQITPLPIFKVYNPFTNFRNFTIIGKYLNEGVYSLAGQEVGPPYYLVGPGYTSIGIYMEAVASNNIEEIIFKSCQTGLKTLGALLINIEKCQFGDNNQWGLPDPENNVLGYDYSCACDYGAYFEELPNAYSSNQICINESRIIWCKVQGIHFQGGSMLNINNCDFEANGWSLPNDPNPFNPTTSDPNTGALFILGRANNFLADVVNLTNNWWEFNLGYDVFHNGQTDMIFNLFGCNFVTIIASNNLYRGVYISTSPNDPVNDIKTINLMGVYCNIDLYNGNNTFVINMNEYNNIGSFISNIFIINPIPISNLQHHKI